MNKPMPNLIRTIAAVCLLTHGTSHAELPSPQPATAGNGDFFSEAVRKVSHYWQDTQLPPSEKLVKVTLEFQQYQDGEPTPYKRFEAINMAKEESQSRQVTAIFFTAGSVKNLLAPYYRRASQGNLKPATVRPGSPMVNRALDGMYWVKPGDPITPKMIRDYFEQPDVSYVVKCADSQPC